MYAKKIDYVDYLGNKRSEDFYFNMNKAELIKWLTTSGGYTLDKLLERLAKEENGRKIMEIFENLIYISYGEISLDGRRFDKTEETKRNFMETEAYSVLFTELVTDAKKAAEFVNNIIPKDLAKEVALIVKNNPDGIPDEMKDYLLSDEKNPGRIVEMPESTPTA